MPSVVDTNEWLSKVRSEDVAALRMIAQCPRLAEEALVAHWRRTKGGQLEFQEDTPHISAQKGWRRTVLVQQGLEFGGTKAFSAEGRPAFRGQNIFAGGLKGEPAGRWAGDFKVVDNPRIYKYEAIFRQGCVFAARKIAQLPTIVRVAGDEVFQNSCVVVALKRYLPLHLWALSRPIQWFAAKTLRAGIIEDLGASWVTREFLRLPVPSLATADQLRLLEDVGGALVESDETLADARRGVRSTLESQRPLVPLQKLIVDGDKRVAGFNLDLSMGENFALTAVDVHGDTLVGDDAAFKMTVPNDTLRAYLLYCLREIISDAETEAQLTSAAVLKIGVPSDLTTVVEAVKDYELASPQTTFDIAHLELDKLTGVILGLSADQVSYVVEQMTTAPFLSELRPMYAYRGYREQPYSTRSGRNTN
jgi:hypothetical protein